MSAVLEEPAGERIHGNTEMDKRYKEIGWDLLQLTKIVADVGYQMKTYCYRDHRKDYFLPSTRKDMVNIEHILAELAANVECARYQLQSLIEDDIANDDQTKPSK